MLMRQKKSLSMGIIMGISFIGVLLIILSPVFGGKNGLEYSDALFNKLAKGSSFFIPELTASLKDVQKEEISVSIKMDNADQAAKAARVLAQGLAKTSVQGSEVKINGNLVKMLSTVLDDSTAMYYDRGAEVKSRYSMDERDVMSTWWGVLNRVAKELQKARKAEETNVIFEVMKKGIEPAYNFYGIEAQKVSDKALTVLGMLAFYILYTMWWGYAIFYMFDGLGLSMKKAKVKQEV